MNLYFDGKDYVIARDIPHAEELWKVIVGDLRYEDDAPWIPIRDDALIKIAFQQWGNVPYTDGIQIPDAALVELENNQFIITAEARYWIAINKPGILCSVEEEQSDDTF